MWLEFERQTVQIENGALPLYKFSFPPCHFSQMTIQQTEVGHDRLLRHTFHLIMHNRSIVSFNAPLKRRSTLTKLHGAVIQKALIYIWNYIYNMYLYYTHRSRVSSGSIVSDYGLDDRAIGVRSMAWANDFSSSLCVQTGSAAHPASCTMGTGGPFPGGKSVTTHPHLVPRSRMSRSYTSSPPKRLHGV
jgi:hypothetical protein